MEEQLNKHFSEYEKLLKTKDYHMLSDQEKSLVNRFSSKEEYGKMRKVILSNDEIIRTEAKTINPHPEILNNLLYTMKSKQASVGMNSLFKNIFRYKLPAYQFAIYAVVLAFVFLFVFKREKVISIDKPVYVYKTDTIEKSIVKETKPNIKKNNKINYSKLKEQITNDDKITQDNPPALNDNIYSKSSLELLGINVDIKEKMENFKPKGRTMHDDSALVKFLVKI
jgi:hypothetical protein